MPNEKPFVNRRSIDNDGPTPQSIADACAAQQREREELRRMAYETSDGEPIRTMCRTC